MKFYIQLLQTVCPHAHVSMTHHGAAGELEDSMESFFLSETSKYLYLLHANATYLPDNYVFTTEGHLLPPFPLADQPPASLTIDKQHAQTKAQPSSMLSWDSWLPNFGNWKFEHTEQWQEAVSGSARELPELSSAAWKAATLQCAQLCENISQPEACHRQELLQSALPLLPLAKQDAALLRWLSV